MKKRQLIAMALSAISAGVLISCAKPDNAETTTATNSNETETATSTTQEVQTSTSNNVANVATVSEAIEITPQESAEYLKHVANEQILPAYQQVVQQSEKLHADASKVCQSGEVSGESLQSLRQQWLALAKAWANAEMINFGPATDSMSNLYINYYPDERGLVHNGVSELVAANPNLSYEQLAEESAIVQGIPGLEEILFANDSLNTGQCQYVISASEALHQRLLAIDKNWQQNVEQLLAMDTTTDDHLGLNRWINSLLSLVETLKSNSLDKPLGITGGHPKGHLPAATAGESRAIFTSKIAALNTALTDPVLTAILDKSKADTQIGNELSTALSETSTLLAQMPEDINEASPEQQRELYEKLTYITRLIKRQLIPALGLQVGFNSTDGD